jgi:hypothetical protein
MNFLEKYVHRRLYNRTDVTQREWQRLRQDQLDAVDRITQRSMLKAAIAGALAVLICYLPYHLMGPSWFPETMIWIPLVDDYLPIELSFQVLSLVVLIAEIAFLTWNNIDTVNKIAKACEFPHPNDPFFDLNIQSLIAVGFEKKLKTQKEIGIDPMQGLSKWRIFLFSSLNLAKAALSNFLFKMILRRLLGRYAIRMFVDLAGIPIYAFWNAWAARRVAREAKTRILANPLVYEFAKTLQKDQVDNPEFTNELYHLLEYIAIIKRDYNVNHYLLSLQLLRTFDIPIDADHVYDKDVLHRITQATVNTKLAFSQLMLVGMALDGQLSEREINHIYQWKKKGIYLFSVEDSKQYAKDFYCGKSILPDVM